METLWRAALRYRLLLVTCAHLLLFAWAHLLSFILRFDLRLAPATLGLAVLSAPIVLPVQAVVFYAFRLYQGWWRYVGTRDLVEIGLAATTSTIVSYPIAMYFLREASLPRSYFLLDWMLVIMIVGGTRFTIRIIRERLGSGLRNGKDERRLVIIGAGDTGETILREMVRTPRMRWRAVALVDDDPAKKGARLHDVPVLGRVDELSRVCERVQPHEILIAVPSATGREMRRIVDACRETGLPFKTLPALNQLVAGQVTVNQIRDVDIHDLLGRDPVRLDHDVMRAFVRGKTALVTGAGGSVGSELARQLAVLEPAELVLLERHENALFHIEKELVAAFPRLAIRHQLVDVTLPDVVDACFRVTRPDVIFHAAAYKHVPLMESHAPDAVLNNVLGTRVVAEAAERYGAEAFILISTDKAVNPTNVMGASKRVAELYLCSRAVQGKTKFMTVRFGNVLGSSGSVVPIFKEQIAAGGPVTVTHPLMERYFMTIPEAAQLVIQAASVGKGGELFILDMGNPVRIADLAKLLIELSGFVPERDIEIRYSGIRPGEKLKEELSYAHEAARRSAYPKILEATIGAPADAESFEARLAALAEAAKRRDSVGVLNALHVIVPEFGSVSEVTGGSEASLRS